ncbi:hypothetical protein BOTBODRAFT_64564 [Botryobasidium botryosum FD-172 SS1]|uniref:Extracellular membrane protein CFEM domain-containing protein n=1 Tax=Botryobasidium botryosum (strain FD-172 SS1) TaxID=930990 RepID=A0A067MQZ3_BOTB1|nr:hypothetical protein BOTBODRAFT_64564 [Botryobasidium botryosum FD-172 SS1]
MRPVLAIAALFVAAASAAHLPKGIGSVDPQVFECLAGCALKEKACDEHPTKLGKCFCKKKKQIDGCLKNNPDCDYITRGAAELALDEYCKHH